MTGEFVRMAVKDLGTLFGVGGAALLLPGAERIGAYLGVTPSTVQKIATRRGSASVRGFADVIKLATGFQVTQHNGFVLHLPASAIVGEQREAVDVAAQLNIADQEQGARVAEVITANHTPAQVLGFMQSLSGELIARQ